MLNKIWLYFKKLYSQWVFKFWPAYRLKKSGAKIGKNVFFGDYVYVELENAKYLTIEDDVVLAAFTKIILHDSSLNNVDGGDILYGQVILKKNCYVGANTTVLPGTIIGENTIVGAHSLVKGILKSNSVYAGVPVKFLYTVKEMKRKWQKNRSNKLLNFQKQNK